MKWLISILFFSASFNIRAQSDRLELDFLGIAESVSRSIDGEASADEISEYFGTLARDPVDLNTAGYDKLQSLFLLSQIQIQNFLKYRTDTGELLSPFELYLIEGFDTLTVNRILPFVTIDYIGVKRDTLSLFRNLFSTSRRSIMLRCSSSLERRQGFLNKKDPVSLMSGDYYLGIPMQFYGRVEIDEPNDFRMGLTFENDPGEPLFFNPSKNHYGFDHYSGFLHFENRGLLRGLTLGDFKLQFGQGLVSGSSLFTAKGSEVISSVKKTDRGISPYQGSSEYGFLRGIALETNIEKFSFTAYASRKNIDASEVTPTDQQMRAEISSFQEDGYHRTPAELMRRGIVR